MLQLPPFTYAVRISKSIEADPIPPFLKEHRLDLLSTLSALLARQSKLRSAADKIANTKARMGKGAHKKVKEGEWVEDESVKEDRNGERKRWVGKEFKWKMERRK